MDMDVNFDGDGNLDVVGRVHVAVAVKVHDDDQVNDKLTFTV